MAQRRALLAAQPSVFAAAVPQAPRSLLESAAALVQGWLTVPGFAPPPALPPVPTAGDPSLTLEAWCAEAGRYWEPDWVILERGEDAVYRLVAGCVCFPSGWALRDKIGQSLDAIHAPVPGLNESLGRQIHTFLDRLKPGGIWWRDNWGLSADSALNHHPSLLLRPLTAETPLSTTWLRYEEQLLARLPGSRDVLFGIRVGRVRLTEILPFPAVTGRLVEALKSMPEDVAVYKGIAPARASLLRQLQTTNN